MGMGGNGGGNTTTATTTSGSRAFNYEVNGLSMEARMNGSVNLDQGGNVSTWYFGNGFSGDRQWAGPIIEAIEGELVEITLTSGMPHSVHLHGLDVDQANDGVPLTSGYVARMNGNGNFGRVDGYTNLGGSYTYTFIAPEAGTYQYHCHVDTVLHYDMGMHGTIIIRPRSGSATEAWDGGPTYSREHVWQMGTFDSSWRSTNVSGAVTAHYRPDCFMINGVNGVDALTDPTVAISANAGEKVLIRTNQTSYQGAKIDFGGLEFVLIAADGRHTTNPQTVTSVYLTPGERYDILLTMPNAGTYDANVTYYDSRGVNVIGSVATTINSL